MSMKIGFAVDGPVVDSPIVTPKREDQPNTTPRPSLVEVYFPDRDASYSYYNDRYDLQLGDLVFVDGKLEGIRGRVVKINYAFKIKLSDYKRVIYRADTQLIGALYLAGSHFISDDPGVLPFDTAAGWLMPPGNEETVSGGGDNPFPLDNLPQSGIPPAIAERGHEYYNRGRVLYLEVNHGRGHAIVQGSRPYTVEFSLVDGMVSDLVCDCYCTARCKHQLAALLQLQESIDMAAANKLDIDHYLMAVSKSLVYDIVLEGRVGGEIVFS